MVRCELFPPVKLAIWEASLDKFVESIQSIPEVIIPILCFFSRIDFYLGKTQNSHYNNIFRSTIVLNTKKAILNLSKKNPLLHILVK